MILQQEPIETTASRFGEIIEPDPVAFSFDAPGWQVLFGVIILVIIIISIRAYRNYVANKFRRDALSFLDEQNSLLKNESTKLVFLCNVLMKKLALRNTDRTTSASLTGKEWVEFLNKKYKQDHFDETDILQIEKAIYAGETLNDDLVNSYLGKVRSWIKNFKI